MSSRDELLPAWATQYYVAGRLAARAGLVPVYGNLLHHAVEMYLKTALAGLLEPEVDGEDGVVQLRAYGHDLQKLWQRYKSEQADAELDRFDPTIHALHEFEELRYPDKIPHDAIAMRITWKPEHAAKSHSVTPAHQYEVIISEVDGLIIEILDRASQDPSFLITDTVIGNSSRRRAALVFQNPHAARWDRPSA
jgi:hypothetical protein